MLLRHRIVQSAGEPPLEQLAVARMLSRASSSRGISACANGMPANSARGGPLHKSTAAASSPAVWLGPSGRAWVPSRASEEFFDQRARAAAAMP